MKGIKTVARVILLLLFFTFFEAAVVQEQFPSSRLGAKMDVVFVLDNSGSMKKNDPNFLTRTAVETFLKEFSGDVHIGIVIFDEKAELILPLTSTSDQELSEKIKTSLGRLDYQGRFTDIPAGIERALYELKQRGRRNAKKIIVFMTDGIVDTGDKAKDEQRTAWLKGELLQEAKRNGIRIFAIAFTEEADYSLIQTISQKTNGNYYRALKAEDIPDVLRSIQKDLSKVTKEPSAPSGTKPSKQLSEAEPSKQPSLNNYMIIGISGAFILILLVVLMTKRKEEVEKKKEEEVIPEAYLESIDPRIGTLKYRITKKVTTIGKQPGVDIHIDQPTVSRTHALIIYEDNTFYIIDQDSTNGTLVKGKEIKPREKVPIFGGDEIWLDRKNKFRFVFIIPKMGPSMIDETKTIVATGADNERSKKEAPEKYEEEIPEKPSDETEPLPRDEHETLPFSEEKPEDKDQSTLVKEAMCSKHPSRRNIGTCVVCGKQGCDLCINICSVCGRTFCLEHLKEKDGKFICEECLKKA